MPRRPPGRPAYGPPSHSRGPRSGQLQGSPSRDNRSASHSGEGFGPFSHYGERSGRPQGSGAARVVPCRVCSLCPRTNSAAFTNAADANGTFCWPCAGRRLNTIIPVGYPEEHKKIIEDVWRIRKCSHAWRLEVESCLEGAALRAATLEFLSACRTNDEGLPIATNEEYVEYISHNLRLYLVLLAVPTRMTVDVRNLLHIPIQRLTDYQLQVLCAALQVSNRDLLLHRRQALPHDFGQFTPPPVCGHGWTRSSLSD